MDRQTSKRTRGPIRAARRGHWPTIELLEERRLLSTVDWIATTSGDWNTASNWSTGQVPGPTDDVVINVSGATPTITIDSGNQSVKSITASDPLVLSGGSLTVATQSTISGPFSLSGGTLNVGGPVTLSGATDWTSGGLDLEGNTLTNTGSITIDAVNNVAIFASSNGTGNLGGSLTNQGTIAQTGAGGPTLNDHTVLDNTTTGVYQFASDGGIGTGGSSPSSGTVVNEGLLEKTGGAGASSIGVVFNNQGGTVAAQSGTLSPTGGGTDTGGTYNASSGATIDLSDGQTSGGNIPVTLTGTYTGSGAGTVNIGLSQINIGQGGATFDFPAGYFQWSSGKLDLLGNTLTNTGSITIDAVNNVAIFASSNGTGDLGGSLTNQGTIAQTGAGGPTLNDHTVLDNTTTGVYQFASDGGIGTGGSSPSSGTVVNEGLLEKTGGAGASSIGVVFNNQGGTVAAQSGTLSPTGGGTDTGGTYNVSSGATIDLSDGQTSGGNIPVTLTGTYTGSGAGTVNIGLSQINIGQGGATFDFPAGYFQWSSGKLDLLGNTLTNTGSITISAANNVAIFASSNGTGDLGGSLINQGTIMQTGAGGPTLTDLTVIDNTATGVYQFASDGGIGSGGSSPSSGSVVNDGHLEMGAGAAAVTIGVNFTNQGGTLDTTAGTLTFNGQFTEDGGTLAAGENSTITLAGGGTLNGGSYSVPQGATIDMSSLMTVSGELSGTGAGTVDIGNGLTIDVGGVTLDFPGAMLQWTGGTINSSLGDLTNLGVMTLAGPNEHDFFDDGTLDNFGSILQTGSGNLSLHSDNQAPTTLKIEPGAAYLIEADSGVDNPDGGQTAIVNEGTIRKTAGSGTSTILVNGTLTNTGTIEADSGALALSGTIAQVSGSTLTGGRWNALGGSTLAFPGGTNITTNQATLTLSGQGATFAGIAGLTSNVGNMTLTEGASFTTTGDFSTTGTLSLDAGSSLSIAGNLTLGSTGVLDVALGGSPSSGQFGRIVATGSATIGGTLNVSLSAGYAPAATDSFNVVSFASESSGFSAESTPLFHGGNLFQVTTGKTNVTVAAVTTAANLEPVSISTSAPSLETGQNLTVDYTVHNLGNAATASTWVDSIFLSADGTIDASSILLGHVTHTGGLAAGASYAESLTAPVPPALPGTYTVILEVDSRGLVADANLGDNTLAASSSLQVSIPTLAVTQPGQAPVPETGTIASGESLVYQAALELGATVRVAANTNMAGAVEILAGVGAIPTESTATAQALATGANSQQLILNVTQPGVYYIVLTGQPTAGAGAPYTLTAQQLPLIVDSVSPTSVGNAGSATLEISGGELGSTDTVQLSGPAGASIPASSTYEQSSSSLYATFDLTAAPVGVYNLQVTSPTGQLVVLSKAVTVQAGQPATLSTQVQIPSAQRPGRNANGDIVYQNTGNQDMPAPLLILTSNNPDLLLSLPGAANVSPNTVMLIGTSPTGPAGILQPGETVQIPFQEEAEVGSGDPGPDGDNDDGSGGGSSAPVLSVQATFETVQSTDPVDYPGLASALGLSLSDPIIQRLEKDAGPDWGGLITMLDQAATESCCNGVAVPTAANVLAQLVNDVTFQVDGGVSGQIFLNSTANPLPGAFITLSSPDGSQAVAASTSQNGSFVIPQVAAGVYNVNVQGYLVSQPVQVTVPASGLLTGLSVTVTEGGVISGVVTESGNALSPGSVSVTATDPSVGSFTVQTGTNGVYTLSGLPDGTYSVTASASGLDSQASSPVAIVSSDSVGGIDFNLEPAATLEGGVVSASGGSAVVQATVLLVDAAGDSFASTTDSNGKYQFGGLPSGSYTLTVDASGFVPAGMTDIVVQPGAAVTIPTLSLTAAATLTVTLTDSSSNPLPSVGVDLTQNGTIVANAETNSNGVAVLTGLSAGQYQIQTKAFPFLSPNASVTLQAGQSDTQTIALSSGVTIQGTVTGGSGQPLSNVPITLLTQNDVLLPTTASASDGAYQFPGLPPGVYALTVGTSPGIDRQIVTLTAGEASASVNFSLAGAILQGTVVEADGATPVANAQVFLTQNGTVLVSAITDSNGNYAFEGVAPGDYVVQAGADANLAGSGSIVAANGVVTVPPIQEGVLTLTGRITDPNGNPVAGATVAISIPSAPNPAIAITTTTSSQGTFSVAGLTAGPYLVVVVAAGFAAQEQTVTLSGSSAPATFSLLQGTTLSGTVTDSVSGTAVTDASVTVVGAGGADLETVQTNSSGEFQAPNLAPGSYSLVVSDPSHGISQITGVTVGTNPVVQNVALQTQTASVQGAVADSLGNPIAGATVLVLGSGDVLGSTTTGFSGQFVLGGLPAGALAVVALAEGYQPSRVAVSTQNGQAVVGISLSTAGVDDFNLFQFLSDFQAAADGFSGFLLSPLLASLDPSNLSSPSNLPSSGQLLKDATDLILGRAPCPALQNAVKALDNAETALDNQFKTYQKDFQNDQNNLGSKLNTLLIDFGSFAIGGIPEIASAEAGLAAEVLGAAEGDVAFEKFVSDVKPALDGVQTATSNLVSALNGSSPSFNELSSTDKFNFVMTQLSTVVNLAGTASTLVKQFLQTEADKTKIGNLGNVLSVLGTAIDLGNGIAAVNDAITNLQDDRQSYQDDINAYLAALHGLSKVIASCQPKPPPPPPAHPRKGGSGTTDSDPPKDPNDIVGPMGFGAQGFIVPGLSEPYQVDFQNDPTASAAAAVVTITDQLSPNLDWNTFQLRSFGFGGQVISVPAGRASYSTVVNLPAGSPGAGPNGLEVQITVALNAQTGLVTWTFTSIDPTTQDVPVSPAEGFLPPDNSSGVGEGFVTYSIAPRSDLTTGAPINAQATVVFDQNAPINTALISNTIDTTPPTSTVSPLPATTTSPNFTVSWSGSDGAGSGIASFDVFVSDNGGSFQPFLTGTTATSATFAGQVGHTYAFFSVATSNVGLVQPTPTSAQAAVAVVPIPIPPPPTIIGETLLFNRKFNKRHKPVGKPIFVGFELDYSTTMNAASAGNPANYQVDWLSIKHIKRKVVTQSHPVPIRVQFNAANNTVDLLLSKRQAFTRGGRIVVVATPPGGVESAAGALLDGNNQGVAGDDGTFTILPKARGITR